MQTSVMLLKLRYVKLENISQFSLIILVVISSSDAFEASKFFYLFNNILLRNMIKSKYRTTNNPSFYFQDTGMFTIF